jgi:hypothetical protein
VGIEQMVGNFAEKLFLGQQTGYKRLNCAQAIAEAFRQEYNFLTEDTVKDFKKMGHGKAPNGECGMLYAAKYIFEKTIVQTRPRNLKSISASLPVRQNARS